VYFCFRLGLGSSIDNCLTTGPCKNNFDSRDVGWYFAGPTTYISQFDRKTPESKRLASAGAVQNIVRSTENDENDTWFIGSVNGGVWMTQSLNSSIPHWENVLDGQCNVICTSISALHASSYSKHIYAGCGGSTSSEQGSDWNVVNSGDWGGVMMSMDSGVSWNMLQGFPVNYYVTDILELPYNNQGGSVILVSAQSHLYNRDDGGIWRSTDLGKTFTRIDRTPTFTLTHHDNLILATHPRNATHSVSFSTDGGLSFHVASPLPWKDGAVPFYTCATRLLNGQWIVAGLIRLPGGFGNNTDSQFFLLDGDDPMGTWLSFPQPTSMDQDGMPKDRMAVMADPDILDLLYVAGNADSLAWRVNVTTGIWTKLWDNPDVLDGSIPHGDCRNFAWDSHQQRLLLVSDGGVFVREQPRSPGGRWLSLNGDYSSLELLSAHYDPHHGRFVAGAQDNCAIVTRKNASSADQAYCFVEGDGTTTFIDTKAHPSRLFGTTQFLGVGTIDSDPTLSFDDGDDDDDDDCGGLCFSQGDRFVEVPVNKYFPEPSNFPFFVHPYTLNRNDPTFLHFWTNGTVTRPSGFYQFYLPYSVQDKDDIGPPTKLIDTPLNVMILDFVSGGYVDGKDDPSLLLAISNSHLYVGRSNETKTSMVGRPLPVSFAEPVTLEYDMSNGGSRILGPLTHAKTLNMAVSNNDSSLIAITGWQTIANNAGDEAIFLTNDMGRTWSNITGDLRPASGVVGKVRPSGLLFVDIGETINDLVALLVGTSSGVMVTFLNQKTVSNDRETTNQRWIRLGNCKEFPITLTADVDYEVTSDKLVAATFGRGIYVLDNAKYTLRKIMTDEEDQLLRKQPGNIWKRQ
jgi:hypothetical protein